jgi:hypothetical protein
VFSGSKDEWPWSEKFLAKAKSFEIKYVLLTPNCTWNCQKLKNKCYEDVHAGLAWKKLKKKHKPISAPSLVKTERLFGECELGKDEDPETSITNQDLQLKSEVMGSFVTDDQFIIQILNSLTNGYKIQML